MPFNANETDIPDLDWDFTRFVPDAKGRTPEPTDDQVFAMNEALRANTLSVVGEDVDPADRTAIAKAYSKLTDEQVRQTIDAQIDAVVNVTVLNPTAEQIRALPFRFKRGYIRSLLKDINNPEGETPDTNT